MTAEPGSFPDDSNADLSISGALVTSRGTAKSPVGTLNGAGAVSFTVALPAAVGS
ncbi:hypothetical protein [Cryobacterium suzukii]|uniref:hypothetical protein n=1 Tax=Cryobacterium suzukii TaxID=1259198 RepID=UPI00141B8AE5|nr:hypothetical protein [Cryobacterium suzukii]